MNAALIWEKCLLQHKTKCLRIFFNLFTHPEGRKCHNRRFKKMHDIYPTLCIGLRSWITWLKKEKCGVARSDTKCFGKLFVFFCFFYSNISNQWKERENGSASQKILRWRTSPWGETYGEECCLVRIVLSSLTLPSIAGFLWVFRFPPVVTLDPWGVALTGTLGRTAQIADRVIQHK